MLLSWITWKTKTRKYMNRLISKSIMFNILSNSLRYSTIIYRLRTNFWFLDKSVTLFIHVFLRSFVYFSHSRNTWFFEENKNFKGNDFTKCQKQCAFKRSFKKLYLHHWVTYFFDFFNLMIFWWLDMKLLRITKYLKDMRYFLFISFYTFYDLVSFNANNLHSTTNLNLYF